MRSKQRERYADQIDRVVKYLERLDWSTENAPDLETLASIANVSSWHFHRVFRLMTGESIGDVLRRVRVARGLAALNGASQVTEAAMASGYATPQAFARAVRRVTGRSPTDVRRSEDILAFVRAQLNDAAINAGRAALSVEITNVEPFTVQAIRNVGEYKDLDEAYGRLFDLIFAEESSQALQGIYGVPLDDPGSIQSHECRFECAVQLQSSRSFAPPIRAIALGGARYFVFRHIGHYNLVHARMDEIFDALLDCEVIHLADVPAYIRYHDQPEERPADELRADIFVPFAWEQ